MSTDPFERVQKPVTAAVTDPTKVQSVSKQWSKISPQAFLIGCGVMFIVFLGLVYGALYFAASSGEFLQSIGLEIAEIKNILKIFALMFFGIVFLGGMYLLFYSIYKVATVKERKGVYVAGIIGAFIWVGATIGIGAFAYSKIEELSPNRGIVSNDFLLPYVMTKDSELLYVNEPWFAIIGPAQLRFELNRPIYDRSVLPELWWRSMTSLEIDCKNGQTLTAWPSISLGNQWWYFPWYCLFEKKWVYEIAMKVNYQDLNTGENGFINLQLPPITLTSDIELESVGGSIVRNDANDELIVGIAPASLAIRANKIFSDLWLKNNRIDWDLTGNGQVDLSENSIIRHVFENPWLQTIYYRLPERTTYNQIWFPLTVRVDESDATACTIVESQKSWNTVVLAANFRDRILPRSFTWTIKDTNSPASKIEKNSTTQELTHTFDQGGRYEVAMNYLTRDGIKWSCSPLTLTIWYDNNIAEFSLSSRKDASYTRNQSDDVILSGNEIIVKDIPIEFKIHDIVTKPDPNATVDILLDTTPLLPWVDDSYSIELSNLLERKLTLEIITDEWKTSTQEYKIRVARSTVRAMLNVDPIVWEDPMTVTLDASISPLYDPDDEIVFFTRDFGDGKIEKNTSQWRVTHTYTYDHTNQVWRYFPKVTIQTRKWSVDSTTFTEGVSVKKQQREATIRIDSHPTQQARTNDIVKMRLMTDGMIKKIMRDFGQGKTFSCENRSCMETTTSYDAVWSYNIRVAIEYEDGAPIVTSPMTMRVFE